MEDLTMAGQTKAARKTANAKKKRQDNSPSWDNFESLSKAKYAKYFRESMQYYNINFSGKDLKPKVIDWMGKEGFDRKAIVAFKKTKDWRVSATMGGIAANLLRGMPEVRDDFNNSTSTAEWLTKRINAIIKTGEADRSSDKEDQADRPKQPINIQDRLREVAIRMSDDIDTAYNAICENPASFDVKSFNALRMLKTQEAKAAHARIIRTFYAADLVELEDVLAGNDEQLVEAYSHLSKSKIKKIYNFLKDIDGACSMVMQEGKVLRTPRTKKPKSKDKLIEKLNYRKTDETFKLVSINPIDIIGASELWVYNTKTRKIGKYVASNVDPQGQSREGTGLSIKGTTIIGFNEAKSIQKTFRKPGLQLSEFMKMGKVKLRKYLDSIKAVDIKLNGRINEYILLLKVVK